MIDETPIAQTKTSYFVNTSPGSRIPPVEKDVCTKVNIVRVLSEPDQIVSEVRSSVLSELTFFKILSLWKFKLQLCFFMRMAETSPIPLSDYICPRMYPRGEGEYSHDDATIFHIKVKSFEAISKQSFVEQITWEKV